jgi:hypothetical protein
MIEDPFSRDFGWWLRGLCRLMNVARYIKRIRAEMLCQAAAEEEIRVPGGPNDTLLKWMQSSPKNVRAALESKSFMRYAEQQINSRGPYQLEVSPGEGWSQLSSRDSEPKSPR